MKCRLIKKWSKYIALVLSAIFFVSSSIGSKAETVEDNSYTLQEFMSKYNVDLYDMMAYFARGFASFPDAYGGGLGYTIDTFADYLESKGKSNLLTDDTIYVDLSATVSGGRGFDADRELRQEMVNFVNEIYIEQNPLPYKICYINSYTYLNTSQFNNYLQYKSVQELIKNSGGFCFLYGSNGWNTSWYLTCTDIPKDNYSIDFYGTTTAGAFTNVQIAHNWQTVTKYNLYTDENVRFYRINPDGSVTTEGLNPTQQGPTFNTVSNANNVSTNTNTPTVFTNTPKNEAVLVFNTLNDVKNYNAGFPQNYYLPKNSNEIVPGMDPFSTNDLYNAGSYYNSIVDNSVSGWTADEVLALVDKILNNQSGGSGNGSGGSGDDNKSMWESIGEAIAGLISGIVTVVEKVANALKDAILGLLDIFVGEDGLFNKLADLVNTDFGGFLSAVFGWLPPEIVTLFSATLVFGIFFSIWKMIRG